MIPKRGEMQSIDAGNAIKQLQELVNAGPGPDPQALNEAMLILFRLGGGVPSGYLSEKLIATKGSFETWLSARKWQSCGEDSQTFRSILLHDIEKLRKALARGAEGQD